MKKIFLFLSLLAILSILLVACTPAEKQCSADAQCVPVQCCHAADAVNEQYGPNCRGLLCTAECVPGTIDCRQGSIKCISGECTVIKNEEQN